MMLKTRSIVRKAPNSATHYISIPASITTDSAYPFEGGEMVSVELDAKNNAVIIRREL